MNYLTTDTISFLRTLEKNNTKEWFDAHRSDYERNVKQPFKAMVEALVKRATEVDPFYDCTASSAIFRINRDVRFSKNKAPYKTNVAASIGPGGRKGIPGFYFHIEPKKSFIGGGAYELQKEQLDAVRNYLMKNPGALPKAMKEKLFAKIYGEILGEKNKILPPLYKEAALKNPFLYHKQFYFMHEIDTKELVSAKDQAGLLFTHFLASLSVNNLLREALQHKRG